MGSLLYALEVPPEGGDTLYADMVAAYEALSEAMKKRIADLKAIHRYADRYRKQQAATNRPSLDATLATMPDAVHPVVRTHPETGRKALFVSEGFTVGIVGLPDAEGRALLDELNAHATWPEFVYAHKWRAGDLVIWDNRSTMHRATDYDDARFPRAMHRTTVAGTVPY
jgi:taurine dioxygenase